MTDNDVYVCMYVCIHNHNNNNNEIFFFTETVFNLQI